MSIKDKEALLGRRGHERAVHLPKTFSSIPGSIELGDVNVPMEQAERSPMQPLMRMVQTCLRHTQLISHGGKILLPTHFSFLGDSHLMSLSPSKPHQLHDDSAGSTLFYHAVPLYGVMAEYLRFEKDSEPRNDDGMNVMEGRIYLQGVAAAEPKKSDPPPIPETKNTPQADQSKATVSWRNVIGQFMQEFNIYDEGGNVMSPSLVARLSHDLTGRLEEEDISPIPHQEESRPFRDVLGEYLSQYFDYDLHKSRAVCKNPNSLNIPLGSAQRAVTPFCFGNCLEGCRFCYVDRSAGSLRYPSKWERSLAEVDEALMAYNPSTGRGLPQPRSAFMDWEPTEHPQFLDIMRSIAHRDPGNQIPVVTHGGSLTKELLQEVANDPLLRRLLLFQVSLNSASPQMRARVMAGRGVNERHHENAIASLPLMHELGIAFDVSIVATTNWLPMDDILHTIRYADAQQPHSYIRVALPTATRDHPKELLLPPGELSDIDRQVTALRNTLRTPVVVTVGLLNRTGLDAMIEGVMPESPAWHAGIRHGSQIVSIGGKDIRSRTEANSLLLSAWKDQTQRRGSPCMVTFLDKDGRETTTDLTQFPQKAPRSLGEKPVGVYGLLLHDDVDFDIFAQMRAAQKRHKLNAPLMITSSIMMPFFRSAMDQLHPDEEVNNLEMVAGTNAFFGGNVCIAGLLTCTDILASLNSQTEGKNPDGIFVSASMFSRSGFDLQGYHYQDLAHRLGIPVIPIKAKTGSL